MAMAAQNVHQVKRLVPVGLVPSVVQRRVDKLWQLPEFRAMQEAEMEFLLGRSPRAAEVPELAYKYTEQMLIRSHMRWHPRTITRQRVKGVEVLNDRDRSRGVILSFTHHYRYEAVFAAILNAGGPPTTMVATEAITRRDAGAIWRQHIRVARRGGDIVNAEIGVEGLAERLRSGEILGLAVDSPGRTPVTFLGRRVLAPFGTPRLAIATDSPIVLLTQRRDVQGPYVQIHEPIEPSAYADPTDLLVEVLDRHGEAILDWPEVFESPTARFGAIDGE
jgi:lauroyl/myristoyl acyltransferase